MTATTNAQARLVDALEAALHGKDWFLDDNSPHLAGRGVNARFSVASTRVKIVGCVERPDWGWSIWADGLPVALGWSASAHDAVSDATGSALAL